MARGTTLANIYTMLKAKLGQNTVQTNTQARYYQLLSDKQKWLANEYDFPFLKDEWDVNIGQNARYVAFPTVDTAGATYSINLERPILLEVKWSNEWQEVVFGIGSQEYNYLDSDAVGQIQDPVQRWDWQSNTQFEIWPKPASAQLLRFTGQRQLNPLVTGTDTADLDDQIIMLFVAADILSRSRQADAQACMQQATERLLRQRGAYDMRPKVLNFGGEGGGSSGSKNNREARERLIPIAVADK